MTSSLSPAAATWKDLLNGGNFLACQLMERIGPHFADEFPPDLDLESALRRMGATVEFDMWCAWAAIMRSRFTFLAPLGGSFQARVHDWMRACFGPEISNDKIERNHRFLEEALELVQSLGSTRGECHQLVDYVFGREVGEPVQEVGGSIVTLAALCLANGIDMAGAGETELARIWTKIEKIRAKQAAKPKHSPLPEAPP